MRLLVLGGTGFLGKAVAARARDRGMTVTALGRGGRPAPEGVEFIAGDRSDPAGLAALSDRVWDAVVEVSTQPGQVRAALAEVTAEHWVYVSSANVYARTDVLEQEESAEVLAPLDGDTVDDIADYGAAKVACENAVREGAGSATIVRAGLIGGRGDDTGRSGYYVWRMAHPTGEDILVPDDLEFPVAVLDVDDLADWIVTAAAEGLDGTFNAAGEATTLGAALRAAREVVGAQAPTIRRVLLDLLEREGVANWMGPRSLPLWIADPAWRNFGSMDTRAARAHGLTTRPLVDTLRGALATEEERVDARPAGLTDEEEIALRAAVDATILPAVFLHGSGTAGRANWPAQQGVPEERRCVFVERLARGDNPDEVAAWVLENAPPRFHLVGHSYGGVTALLLATRHPEQVASLTLIDPAAFGISAEGPHTRAHMDALSPVFDRADDPAVSDLEFSAMFAAASGLPAPNVPEERRAVLAAHLRAIRPPWTLDVDPTVPQRISTLVIVGDSDEMYAEVADVLRAQGATVVPRSGLGHRPHDDPEVTEMMREHWSSAENQP